MTNMTYALAIAIAIAMALAIAIEALGADHAEATDRLKALTAQLAKRGSKGGLTKTQKANEGLKAIILEILGEAGAFMLMADLMADERLADLSVQKMGALLGQLVKAGEVQKVVHKKRTMYAVEGGRVCRP